jgi:hypothetical protein
MKNLRTKIKYNDLHLNERHESTGAISHSLPKQSLLNRLGNLECQGE